MINNAGVEAGAKTYHTIDEDDWDFVLDTNSSQRGWSLSSIPIESLISRTEEHHHDLQHTDSRNNKGPVPLHAVSKGGMTRMTEVMSPSAAKYNIRVNALAPGYFLTDVSRIFY